MIAQVFPSTHPSGRLLAGFVWDLVGLWHPRSSNQADTHLKRGREMPGIEGTPHVTRTITGIMAKSEGFFN